MFFRYRFFAQHSITLTNSTQVKTPKSDQISNFPCSLTRSITSHSMKNVAFHSLLGWKMIILAILTTSLIHSSLKGWENVLFELGSERVNVY